MAVASSCIAFTVLETANSDENLFEKAKSKTSSLEIQDKDTNRNVLKMIPSADDYKRLSKRLQNTDRGFRTCIISHKN